MCPSYRVTRDEQHLTRGRANTLRLALSGQLGADAFTSEAMHDTMDLCVGCKGCKRDCPTGVDMAKMKVEFLDHYKKRHGHTLRDQRGPGCGLRAWGSRCACKPARPHTGWRPERALVGLRPAQAAQWQRRFLNQPLRGHALTGAGGRTAVVSSSTPQRHFSRPTRSGLEGCRPGPPCSRGQAVPEGRHLCGRPTGEWMVAQAKARRANWSGIVPSPGRHRHRGMEKPACNAARRDAVWEWATPRAGGRAGAVRGVPGARSRRRRLDARRAAAATGARSARGH